MLGYESSKHKSVRYKTCWIILLQNLDLSGKKQTNNSLTYSFRHDIFRQVAYRIMTEITLSNIDKKINLRFTATCVNILTHEESL